MSANVPSAMPTPRRLDKGCERLSDLVLKISMLKMGQEPVYKLDPVESAAPFRGTNAPSRPGPAEPPSVSAGYLRNSQLRRQLEEKVKEATQARQVAEESIAAVREVLEAAKRIDADVGSATKVLADADAAMGGKDYKLASEKAKEALERGGGVYRGRGGAGGSR